MRADQLIAHRGWQRHYPENTLPALQGALDAGALAIEFDIQLDRHQQPWLCHDPTLQRLCASALDVCQADSAELKALSAHEPERLGSRFIGTPLARLEQAVGLLTAHPQVTCYAELKRHSLRNFGVEAMLDAVLPHLAPLVAHCVLISFDLPVLARARQRGWTRLAPVLLDWSQVDSAEVTALAPELIFVDRDRLPPGPLSPRFPLAVYEVGDANEARELLQRGASRIETFAIGELLAQTGPLAEPGIAHVR